LDENQTMAGRNILGDKWMKDRPVELIKHCLHEKSLAEVSHMGSIEMISNGHFQIRCDYEVSFGDDESMPYCTCPSWKSSAYPCKHFFLIFKSFPDWNWGSVSSLYRDSPFLNLDLHLTCEQEPNSMAISSSNGTIPLTVDMTESTTGSLESEQSNSVAVTNNKTTQYPELSRGTTTTSKSLIEKRRKVRSLLGNIERSIHLIEDNEELLETLNMKLQNALDMMKASIAKSK